MIEEEKKSPTPESLAQSVKVVELEARKGYLQQMCKENTDKMKSLKEKGFIESKEYDLDAMLLKKVEGMTSDEVRVKAKNIDWLNEVYTIPETGEVVGCSNAIPKERADEYRAAYLVYSVQTEETIKNIDLEYEKLDAALKEFDEGTRDAYLALSSNVMAYTQQIKAHFPDDKEKLELCKYIESGYNLAVLFDVLEEHPTVIQNTVSDLSKESRIKTIGSRYVDKLRRAHTNATLMPFLSGKEISNSLEYKCLPKGTYQEGREDFFIFSCIRFFAMADWDGNPNISKFHASLILMLKRLVSGELEGEAYDLAIESITKYLALFN